MTRSTFGLLPQRRALCWLCWLALCGLAVGVALGFAPQDAVAEDAVADGAATKKIVFIAGTPSHGFGAHDHQAGCMLLAKAINENVPAAKAVVFTGGWPKDDAVLDDADCIVMYGDGGGGHMVMKKLERVAALAKKGTGIVCIHYAVEVPKGEAGDYFVNWIGGYFETFWSVNPHWTATFGQLPDHPVARGVRPFTINDEWYYHMRFRDDMKGVAPILTATPPDATRQRGDDAHGGNPTVRARLGMSEHVAWAAERPDGGRGFGITGGHVHWNWGHDDFRKLVLNAIVWCAKMDVPEGGVPSKSLTVDDLLANHDENVPDNFDKSGVEKMLTEWRAAQEALTSAAAEDTSADSKADEEGFKSLFDGKTLDGWDGNPKLWSVKDGTITGQTTKENPTNGNTFLFWKGGNVGDFELRLSYRIVGGNSGIQYRSKDFGNWVAGGYQGDFEAGKTYTGILYEERMTRGIMAQRGEKVVFGEDGKREVVGSVGKSDEIQAAIKNKDWNDYTIIAKGHELKHIINGKTTIEVTDNDPKKFVAEGILALQLHAGPPMMVQFKDVRIKELK
ncbi:MAG: family 16 glycoside hydrolase [Pirellulales bacterium]